MMIRNKILFSVLGGLISPILMAQNPIVQTCYTTDPAPMVHDGRLYVYTGHDEDKADFFWMQEWRVYSTDDMVNWTDHGSPLAIESFEWADDRAWAAQCVERQGKFYWYVCLHSKLTGAMAIGVAVGDSPVGPFRDAIGKPLCDGSWDYIDPTVYIDEDGSSYIYWGGMGNLFGCKLKDNMIELDEGRIQVTNLKNYEEAPWLFKKDGLYYLAYSTSNGYRKGPIRYATSASPLGPWQDRDDILGVAYNSFTNHEAIVEYKDKWYMVYHNGALPGGGDYNRSVCIDRLFFNEDGTIQFVEQTTCGPEGKNAYNNWGPHAYAGVDATCLITTGVTLNSRIVDDGRMIEDMWWKWEVVMAFTGIRLFHH